jgi:hypothetical protein
MARIVTIPDIITAGITTTTRSSRLVESYAARWAGRLAGSKFAHSVAGAQEMWTRRSASFQIDWGPRCGIRGRQSTLQ